MFYDLHIHSALSPCADNDMTANNIINMAKLKGLDLIAICDHNSVKQQLAISKVAKEKGIDLLYGIEIQTKEEVHVLAYFNKLEDCLAFGNEIETLRLKIKNEPRYFGDQLILDANDEIVTIEEWLLIASLELDLDQLTWMIHQYHGVVVLAHVLDRINGIIQQLGFIPQTLVFDGIEIKSEDQRSLLIKQYPWLSDKVWLINSDAHSLDQISDAKNMLTKQDLLNLWRNVT
ncbi:MAG: PHP domain-containing protein [Erysipelotrichaceae bacterium]|nr:PHP domain-containing protein [Erysipelotrichaceae bacterium]MDD3923860.1 PHP domain-containing protein [Erysipelotrichaceae bacterium]MDD4641912.1 PHP domain-containing protein [Erysipelotrichaceae bacterium]